MTLKLFADEFFKESFYFAPCLFHPNLLGVSKYFYSTKITFEKAKQVSQVVNNGQPWLTAEKQWSTVVQTVIHFHTLYQVNNK